MAKLKPKLVIAGPGAGKTHNMVETILQSLQELSPARYMVVITYTNSATENIKRRLAKRTHIPPNLFIGTIHSFMNRFIVVPFGSFLSEPIGREKQFLQYQIGDLIPHVEKNNNTKFDYKQVASVKSKLTKALNEKGYITFDQSLNIAKKAMSTPGIASTVANRIQFLFVDEFQDTDNKVFSVIKKLKAFSKTKIYVVGDPEQYISSFDSSIRKFDSIPILEASKSFEIDINETNHRSTKSITRFLNQFNHRAYKTGVFQQECKKEKEGLPVTFIEQHSEATHIIQEFNKICEKEGIPISERCIVAKNNWLIKRIDKALQGKYKLPDQIGSNSLITVVKDVLLSKLQMNQAEFCKAFNCDSFRLRMISVEIIQGVAKGEIESEEDFVAFVSKLFNITLDSDFSFDFYSRKLSFGLPINIKDLKGKIEAKKDEDVPLLSTIHKIKGLESRAVLAISKNQEELLLWLLTNMNERDKKRKDKGKSDRTDYPRIGYVAFSRAKELLCIACMEPISFETKTLLKKLGVKTIGMSSSSTTEAPTLFD